MDGHLYTSYNIGGLNLVEYTNTNVFGAGKNDRDRRNYAANGMHESGHHAFSFGERSADSPECS